ncbi:MAG TPA: LemA family protein [Chitinophagaceae bacterium]|nr:LemA family protein [Chitinophagaceae bacterium]
MKGTRNVILLSVAALILIFFVWGCSSCNNIKRSANVVDKAWSDVQAQYERKKNLYENVVATIKGAARNEDTTLIKIVQMRSRIPNVDPNNPQTLNEANHALDQMKNSILNINVEAYPTIQSTQAFRDFQAQIEGTENRVTVAIRDWSQAVLDYNNKVTLFPGSVFASVMGMQKKPYFTADEGAKDTKVDFGN